MHDLTVTLIQTELHWENIPANLELFERKIDAISEKTHLIILPEMFSTGFTMNARDCAETMEDSAVSWLMDKSRQKDTDITGSVIIEEKGKYYNRLIWAKPDGSRFTYDKAHLFRLAGEEAVYTIGREKITVLLKGWRIRPFICYDLRFPIWTRNIVPLYDIALFLANWPEKRSAHWRLLLQARAIENQCYVIGVNRIGEDGNGYPHCGDLAVIDAQGRVMFEKRGKSCIYAATLSHRDMEKYRKYFPVWMDADKGTVC